MHQGTVTYNRILYRIYVAPTVCAALYNMRPDSTVTIQEELEGCLHLKLTSVSTWNWIPAFHAISTPSTSLSAIFTPLLNKPI